jgi:hypothetical protein
MFHQPWCLSTEKDYSSRTSQSSGSRLLGRMADPADEDYWLGTLHSFPKVLHARAAFSFDINTISLQKALFSALSSLQASSIPREITVADRDGYEKGRLDFKIGIGNGEGFDILDAREKERLLNRVENYAPFNTIDVVFHLHYSISDGRKHKPHEDHYVMRLVFKAGMFEVLAHHIKGIRRVDSGELVRLVLAELNSELARNNLSELNLEAVDST